MGQALRRVTGRAQASAHRPPPVEPVKSVERRATVGPTGPEPPAAGQDHVGVPDPGEVPIVAQLILNLAVFYSHFKLMKL